MLCRNGLDGPWASFAMGVDVDQRLHIVPGMSFTFLLAPSSTEVSNGTCPQDLCQYGMYVDPTKFDGTSFRDRGSYDFQSLLPAELGRVGRGRNNTLPWGTGVLTFGNPLVHDPALNDQALVLANPYEVTLGVLGLSNLNTSLNSISYSGYLSSLYSSNYIPSISFSYTAGSVNSKSIS
jgi:hypothetical protein